MVAVVAEFVAYIQREEEATGYAQGKAKNVYEGEYLGADQISEGDLKVVLQHAQWILPPMRSNINAIAERARCDRYARKKECAPEQYRSLADKKVGQ